MAISSEGPAPYAPANNVLFAIEQYRDKGYDAITKELMLRLGFSGSYATRTISALRLLDLIDEGVPTSSFKELRKATDDEYPQRLDEVLRNAYAEVFEVVDPATASYGKIDSAFKLYKPTAQRKGMVTLFMSLCEAAGIISSERAPRKRSRRTVKSTSKNPLAPAENPPSAEEQPRAEEPSPQSVDKRYEPGTHPAIAGVISMLPSGGRWAPSDRQRWLRALEGTLDLIVEVEDAPDADV